LGFSQDEADAVWNGSNANDIIASASVPHYLYTVAIATDDIVQHGKAGWPTTSQDATQLQAGLSLVVDCMSPVCSIMMYCSGHKASSKFTRVANGSEVEYRKYFQSYTARATRTCINMHSGRSAIALGSNFRNVWRPSGLRTVNMR